MAAIFRRRWMDSGQVVRQKKKPHEIDRQDRTDDRTDGYGNKVVLTFDVKKVLKKY